MRTTQARTGIGARPFVKYAIRVALTVGILTLLLRTISWSGILDAFRGAAIPLLVLMYTVALLRQLIDASQIRYLMARVGMTVHVHRVFLASQLSSFYSLIVPGEIAASAAKWANLSSATGKKSLVLNVLLYNKMLLTAGPLLVGAVALLIDNPLESRWGLAPPVAAIAVIIVMMILLYHPRLGVASDRILRRLGRVLPPRVAEKASYAFESLGQVRAMPSHTHLVMVGYTTLGLIVGVARFYLGMKVLGIDVSLPSVLWISAFLKLASLLPITIANLGIREGLLVFALAASDVPAEQAVALGLLGFSTIVLNAIIGAGYQISLIAGWASARPTADEVATVGEEP